MLYLVLLKPHRALPNRTDGFARSNSHRPDSTARRLLLYHVHHHFQHQLFHLDCDGTQEQILGHQPSRRPEVQYSTQWHVYANIMTPLFTRYDGKTIADVAHIWKAGACEASGTITELGWVEYTKNGKEELKKSLLLPPRECENWHPLNNIHFLLKDGCVINCANAGGNLLHIPQHFLYFFPLPQGQGAFLPTFSSFSFFW